MRRHSACPFSAARHNAVFKLCLLKSTGLEERLSVKKSAIWGTYIANSMMSTKKTDLRRIHNLNLANIHITVLGINQGSHNGWLIP